MLLTKSQQRYPHYQNLLYAIIMISRKVSHYFDENSITIVSSTPLADILNNPGATGRVALLLEIHEGTCGHHASSRALVAKAFRAGFYCPTAMRNVEDIVRRCIACQKFTSKPHAPASELKTIPVSWPFTTWGLDMVGPLKKSSKGGRTLLLVAVDKFTKWIEAIPITSSTALTAVNFIKSLIFRFGVPHNIITDNGTNFTTNEF